MAKISAIRLAKLQRDILRDEGWSFGNDQCVLDLGCGNGSTVQAWLDLGFQAYGCDFKFKEGKQVEPLRKANRIHCIASSASYRLPYPDGTFDLLISNQVMEHVQDYRGTLAEMRRVLKPGGMCLHLFPARWRPIEPHVMVPLGTVIRQWHWLALWALLGVRTTRQKGLGWKATADANHAYLKRSTNYLSEGAIIANFRSFFTDVKFADTAFLRNSPNPRGRMLYSLTQRMPMFLRLYRTAWTRVVLAKCTTQHQPRV